MPGNCVNSSDNLCYICDEVMFARQWKAITVIVKMAYRLYFGCKIGDQVKSWAPHMCCRKCVTKLSLDMVHPVVCCNNRNTLQSVEHNTCVILKCYQDWLHVSALQEAIIRPSIKTWNVSVDWYRGYGATTPCAPRPWASRPFVRRHLVSSVISRGAPCQATPETSVSEERMWEMSE
jgi:hypothetical protein